MVVFDGQGRGVGRIPGLCDSFLGEIFLTFLVKAHKESPFPGHFRKLSGLSSTASGKKEAAVIAILPACRYNEKND